MHASSGGTAIGHVSYTRPDGTRVAARLEPRPAHVAGREELLADMRARLEAGDGGAPVVVALTGLGGVGKTTAALEYAHRHVARYDVVWHFHAEDATALLAQFGELASLLDPDELLDRRDPVARVHAALAKAAGPWLLLLDNVRDHAAAARWLPVKGRGQVLVTTQDGQWPHRQAIEVGGLSLEAAAEFLFGQAIDRDMESARAVAAELGLLPLALAQAAGYVASTGRTLAEYLRLLRADRAQVLARGAPTAHAIPVVQTWLLALRELAESSPGSLTLLRLLACLAPEEIPFRLLLETTADLPADLDPEVVAAVAGLRSGPFALDDAVTGLRRHSLIGPPSQVVTVHRLVQSTTLDSLGEARAAWRGATAALVEASVPVDVEPPTAWPACAALLPHARAVLGPLSPARRRLADYLGHSGDYAGARTAWAELTDEYTRTFGPEHPETLTARAEHARWTGEAGDPVAARDQLRAVAEVRARVSGHEHPDTLEVRVKLADWTGQAGDFVAARDLLRELVPIRVRTLGPEHPDTLTVRGSLAGWTGQAGDTAGARALYWALIPERERISGPEHPETLALRGNLAYWTGQDGDAAAARDLYAQLLPLRERVSGPAHPDTVSIRASLAEWTGRAGDAAAARDMFQELVPLSDRVFGASHPEALTIRANLANWTGYAGDPARARDLYGELIPVWTRVSGPEHPNMLGTLANLADWTGQAGDASGARDRYRELVPLWERVAGRDHPHTLIARGNVAKWTGLAGDAVSAREQFRELAPLVEHVSGPKHPTTLIARANLADWSGQSGDREGARDLFRALIPTWVEVFGAEHPDTLTVLGNHAHWTGEAGDPARARDLYAELTPLRVKVSGPDHPDTRVAEQNLDYWARRAKIRN